MNNKGLVLIALIVITGCSTSMRFTGNYTTHFTVSNMLEIRNYYDSHKKMTNMIVGGIVVNDSLKIGLYKCILYKQPQSVNALNKVLKFDDKIVYTSDSISNQKTLIEFKKKYSNFFTEEQIQQIHNSFMKGTEIEGNLL